jgi:hypothetical protein
LAFKWHGKQDREAGFTVTVSSCKKRTAELMEQQLYISSVRLRIVATFLKKRSEFTESKSGRYRQLPIFQANIKLS